MTADTAFVEIASILLIAVLVGTLGTWLRQPLIVSFIAVGIMVGPAGLGLVTQHEEIELLASIGISLLLFVVGLKLDFHMVRTIGPVALATGVGQILFTSVLGFFIALALGMDPMTATYVAVALTFSSTIIIVKLLSDKREIDALHGRIAVGLLIVQDVAVILAMIGITALAAGATGPRAPAADTAIIAVSGVGFLAVVFALSIWVLPGLTARLARSPELLVVSAIAWAVALAAAGEVLGFSREVGAFLAGASLGSTPYRDTIGSRLVSVRDFLLLFFFIDLGARLDLSLLGTTVGDAVLLSAFVLIGNPLIVMAIMGVMGYRKRTGFLTGLTVAQISEFSLILGALGVSVGHIDDEAMGLITTVGLVTIGLSTYMILYSGQLYEWAGPWLGLFERRMPYREIAVDSPLRQPADVVVFGLGRYGGGIVRHLLRRHRRVVGVDFDPQALEAWRAQGLPVVYGDATDPELFDHLPLNHVKWVVSTAPDLEASRVLLRHLRDKRYAGRVAVSHRVGDEEAEQQLEGADVLLRPYADAAEQAADAITTATDRISAVATVVPGMREVRLPPGSVWVGQVLADIRLRERFGATVLAVTRAGRGYFNPGPEFRLFPGDRLVLAADRPGLDQAVEFLEQHEEDTGVDDEFILEEVGVREQPEWVGRSLAELELPRRFGVTVLAVASGDAPPAPADPHRPLGSNDRLIVGAARDAFERLRGASHPEWSRNDSDVSRLVAEGPARVENSQQ